MTKRFKKCAAAAMAAMMTFSAMAMNIAGVSADSYSDVDEAVVLSASGYEIAPYYTQFKPVSFGVTESYTQTNDDDPIIVTDSPARLSYYSCTVGAASVTIYVNGVYYNTYTIPASSGATISHTINCAVGDKITYKVTPWVAGGYARATGSFTIYY